MATPVTQYTTPDPSLSGYANFQSFVQYVITGTNYIFDYKALIVYIFNPATPGELFNSEGSFAQFEAYLAANPVTSTLPNPAGPPGVSFGFPYNFVSTPPQPSNSVQTVYDQTLYDKLDAILLELRAVRFASASIAEQCGGAKADDFNPDEFSLSNGSQ